MGWWSALRRRREARALQRRAIPDALWDRALAALPFVGARPPEQRERLRRLASLFLDRKEFSGAGGLEVTDEIALAVAVQACLPVLELGIDQYDNFVGIVLHPDAVVAPREVTDEHGVVHAYDEELSGEANYSKMKTAVMEIVGQHFRPEFINRVDDIVVFHPLGKEQLRSIVDIQLGYLRKRLADRDIELNLDTSAMDLLGEAGFDPVYGARPLKRAIQQQVENPLAQRILRGEFGPGAKIAVTAREGVLQFAKA